jgi:outer membrane beta-barrel protein
MMRTLRLSLLLLLVPLAAFAQKSEEEAGDTSEADKDSAGPLRERVRPVSGHVFLMKGRFEISPGFGLSFKDAFFTKWTPGLALTYHFNDSFAVSGRVGYAISVVSNAAQICTTSDDGFTRACAAPTREVLTDNNAFGQLGLAAGLELQWSPIYGKIGLVAEKFLSFNMYGALGPTLVMYGPANTMTVGGNVGIGFRFFINKFLCVRTELRDLLYNESFPTTTDPSGALIPAANSFRNQLMGEFGLSIFIPSTFEGG